MALIKSIVDIIIKPIWTVAGIFALIVGALGVILPILPTTPFVILAAFCFAKSSPLFSSWLENNRLFGPIIADWRATGAIAPRYKAIAIFMMASALALSFALDLSAKLLAIQATCILLAATFILTRPNGR